MLRKLSQLDSDSSHLDSMSPDTTNSLTVRYVQLKQQQESLDVELGRIREVLLLGSQNLPTVPPSPPPPSTSLQENPIFPTDNSDIITPKDHLSPHLIKDKPQQQSHPQARSTKVKSTSLSTTEPKGLFGFYKRRASLFSKKSDTDKTKGFEDDNDLKEERINEKIVKKDTPALEEEFLSSLTKTPPRDFPDLIKTLRSQVNMLNLRLIDTEQHYEDFHKNIYSELNCLKKENFILRQSLALHKERLDKVNDEKEALSLAVEHSSENAFNLSNTQNWRKIPNVMMSSYPRHSNSLLIRRGVTSTVKGSPISHPSMLLSRSLSERFSPSNTNAGSIEVFKQTFMNSCAKESEIINSGHRHQEGHEKDPLFLASFSSPILANSTLQTNKSSSIENEYLGRSSTCDSVSPKSSRSPKINGPQLSPRKSLSASMYLLNS